MNPMNPYSSYSC